MLFVQTSWNVMAHVQKPDCVFRRNGRVHLNRRARQFSRLLAVEECVPAVVMLDTPWFEVAWRVLATLSIRQFTLRFSSRASPCAITFQLECTTWILSFNNCIFCLHSLLYATYLGTRRLFQNNIKNFCLCTGKQYDFFLDTD